MPPVKQIFFKIAALICALMILNMLFIQKNHEQYPWLMGALVVLSVVLTFINTRSSDTERREK